MTMEFSFKSFSKECYRKLVASATQCTLKTVILYPHQGSQNMTGIEGSIGCIYIAPGKKTLNGLKNR